MQFSLFSERCEYKFSAVGCAMCTNHGFPAGTMIETSRGPRPIESIDSGTLVSIFQESFASPVRVEKRMGWPKTTDCSRYVLPVHIPRFTIGNTTPLILQQEMRVLFADYALTESVGPPYLTIRVADLVGNWGVDFVRPEPKEMYSLHFEDDVILNIEGHTFVHVPGIRSQTVHDDEGFAYFSNEKVLNLSGEQVEAYLESLSYLEPEPTPRAVG